jgi:PAS domain S-box-containing protein
MEYTLFVIIAPLAAAISVGVAIYAWRYRGAPGASVLVWHMSFISGWLVLNTCEMLAQSEVLTILCDKLAYWFIAGVPVTGLAFALHYTSRKWWLAFPRFLVFCAIPIITVLLVQTSEWNNLVWQSYEFVRAGYFLTQRVTAYGLWFWVYVIYAYLLMILSVSIIVISSLRAFKIFRQQATWVIVGAVTPLIANLVYIFRIIPGLHQDYSPMALAFGGICFAVGIFHLRLFDVRPTARNLLVDSMSDGMIVLDSQNRIIDINPAAQTMAGVTGDTAVGHLAEQVLPAWDTIAPYIQPVSNDQIEITLSTKGAPRYFDMRVVPLSDQGGAYGGYLITLHDITHRKSALEEQERLIEELDAFAHTVAHNLKTPLNSAQGFVELLKESLGELPDERQELYVRVIQRNISKSFEIIKELLFLSGVRNTSTIPIGPIAMGPVVAEACRRLEFMTQEYNATITVAETWPPAQGYAPWIEEVWMNYLSNALKYGGQPPVITVGADTQPDGFARFWVQDNGPGILPDDQVKLFTPFTRLNRAELEGHGLGLSIVQRIVNRLGGEVGMESKEGEGSLFFFTLPGQGVESTE